MIFSFWANMCMLAFTLEAYIFSFVMVFAICWFWLAHIDRYNLREKSRFIGLLTGSNKYYITYLLPIRSFYLYQINSIVECVAGFTDGVLHKNPIYRICDVSSTGIQTIDLDDPSCDPIEKRVNDPLGDRVNDSLGNRVNDSLRDRVNDPLGDRVNDSLRDRVNDPLGDRVNDSLGNRVNDSLGNRVNDPLGNRVSPPLKKRIKITRIKKIKDIEIIPVLKSAEYNAQQSIYKRIRIKNK